MLIDPTTLELQVEPAPWRDLMARSAAVLKDQRIVSDNYYPAILDSLARNGAYMLVAPRVLLAHSRPEAGALGTGISLITTREDVLLQDNPAQPVRLFFTLAANNNQAHLELLAHLATVLVDQALLDELMTSTDPARVATIINPA